MVYTVRFFLFKMQFHSCNVFGSCIIHILYTGCAKIKKNNSFVKRLRKLAFVREIFEKCHIKFHVNLSGGSWDVPCGRTGRQTDSAKLFVGFSQFCECALVVAVRILRAVSCTHMDLAIWIGSSRWGGFRTCQTTAHFNFALLNSSHSGRTEIQMKFALITRINRVSAFHDQSTNYKTYVTDSFSKVLEKLIVPQIVTKLPTLYGTRRFITAFTRARNPSVPSATSP